MTFKTNPKQPDFLPYWNMVPFLWLGSEEADFIQGPSWMKKHFFFFPPYFYLLVRIYAVSWLHGKWGQPSETAGFVVVLFALFCHLLQACCTQMFLTWSGTRTPVFESLTSSSSLFLLPSPLPYPLQSKFNRILWSQMQLYFHILD